MGSYYHSDEEYDEAEKEFKAALAVDPARADTYFRLALLYQSMERWSDAFTTLDKLLELDEGNRDGLYQVGRTAAMSGQGLDRAVEALGLYLEGKPAADEPSLAWAHYRLGLVYEKKGDTGRARKDPEHDQAKKALKKLS